MTRMSRISRPLVLARVLVGPRRSQGSDHLLALFLAVVAGASNAGGFFALAQYTSHMTGYLAILNATGGATVIITLAEIFPVEVRATGMSLVYTLGVAIFGGFGQFIVTWLIKATGSPIAPAYYVMACSLATILALRTIPEMRGRILD